MLFHHVKGTLTEVIHDPFGEASPDALNRT